jgi:hypothetical protein
MNRLYTPKEWLLFLRNGAVVATTAAVPLCWYTARSADEIAVVIATPLLLYNTILFLVPAAFSSIICWFAGPAVQQPPAASAHLNNYPLRTRVLLHAAVGSIVTVIFCFGSGVSIFVASYAYPALHVAWAVHPAHVLSEWMVGLSTLPLVALIGFLAGGHYTGRLWVALISSRILKLENYWPTAA